MGWGSKKNPATGRSKREAVNHRNRAGGGPERRNGKIVPKGRLAFQRDRKTGKK
jgi:hypothetical protein